MMIEQIFDIVCLIASYGILFLLPQKMDVFFYLIFGLSAFLFCIGFFRLGFTFDTPDDARGELFAGLSYAVFGILLNAAGLYCIIKEQGSGRSITIATLLLIEALVLFAMAGSGFKTQAAQRRLVIVFRVVAVLLVIFGVVFAIMKHITVIHPIHLPTRYRQCPGLGFRLLSCSRNLPMLKLSLDTRGSGKSKR